MKYSCHLNHGNWSSPDRILTNVWKSFFPSVVGELYGMTSWLCLSQSRSRSLCKHSSTVKSKDPNILLQIYRRNSSPNMNSIFLILLNCISNGKVTMHYSQIWVCDSRRGSEEVCVVSTVNNPLQQLRIIGNLFWLMHQRYKITGKSILNSHRYGCKLSYA